MKKIDCTGLLSESVQAMFQDIVKACVEEFPGGKFKYKQLYKEVFEEGRFNERATEAINNLVCLGSGKRPSFLMREKTRWLVKLGTWSPGPSLGTQFGELDHEADELMKYLEDSNRPHDKALLYILLGKWIQELKNSLHYSYKIQNKWPPSKTSDVKSKLRCATWQRALLSCFHAFDASAKDWCFGGSVSTVYTPLKLVCLARYFELCTVETIFCHPSLFR